MLGIRRETDYAVRTILHLASVGEGVSVTVRDIAMLRRLPLSFVRRIVARLGAAGIVETTRGMRGGVQLARPATDISLLDVIGAMEGGVTLNPCVATPHTCPLSDSCPAQRAWTDATRVLEDHLASVRFSALAGVDRRHIPAHRALIPVTVERPAAAKPAVAKSAAAKPAGARRAVVKPSARRSAGKGRPAVRGV